MLIVEDEPSVRRILGRVLREQGYRVLQASQGRDALAIAGDPATGLTKRDWPFLAKPVAPDGLARKVRELLDG